MLAAEIETTTLIRSLLIALVVVAPYGVHKWRQVQALRRERLAASTPDDAPEHDAPPPAPRLEDVIATIDELGANPAGGPATVLVPSDATVDGRPVAPAVLDALVRDALARSGLVATAEVDTPEGRRIECAPAPARPR